MNKCDPPFYCEGLKRGHIFWCHTFWGGELAGGRVVWVLGMFGMEGVFRCVWQGVTFFGVALFGVGVGFVGGSWWGSGLCGCRVVVLVGVEGVVGVEVSRGWLGWWGWYYELLDLSVRPTTTTSITRTQKKQCIVHWQKYIIFIIQLTLDYWSW